MITKLKDPRGKFKRARRARREGYYKCVRARGRPKRVAFKVPERTARQIRSAASLPHLALSPLSRVITGHNGSEEVFDVVAEEREVLRELVSVLGLERRLDLEH